MELFRKLTHMNPADDEMVRIIYRELRYTKTHPGYVLRMPSHVIKLSEMTEGDANMFLITYRNSITKTSSITPTELGRKVLRKVLSSIASNTIRVGVIGPLRWIHCIDPSCIPRGKTLKRCMYNTSIKVARWLYQNGYISYSIFGYVDYRLDIIQNMTDLLALAPGGMWMKTLGVNCNAKTVNSVLMRLANMAPSDENDQFIKGMAKSGNIELLKRYRNAAIVVSDMQTIMLQMVKFRSTEGMELFKEHLLNISQGDFARLLCASLRYGIDNTTYLLNNTGIVIAGMPLLRVLRTAMFTSEESFRLILSSARPSQEQVYSLWQNAAHRKRLPEDKSSISPIRILYNAGLFSTECFDRVVFCQSDEMANEFWDIVSKDLHIGPEHIQGALNRALDNGGCVHAEGLHLLIRKGAMWNNNSALRLLDSPTPVLAVGAILLKLPYDRSICMAHLGNQNTARAKDLMRVLQAGKNIKRAFPDL